MNKIQIEEQLQTIGNTFTPNVLESIKKQSQVLSCNKVSKPSLFSKKLKLALSFCSLFIVCLACFFVYMGGEKERIYMDVNPSVELIVNYYNQVKSVNCLNEDATKIIDEKQLVGKSVDSAVSIVTNALCDNNYLSEDSSAIILTSYMKNNKSDTEQLKRLAKIVKETCKNNKNASSSVNVLDEVASNDDKKVADDNNISVGKAKLIERIISLDSTRTFDELKTLSIKELNEIFKNLKKNHKNK